MGRTEEEPIPVEETYRELLRDAIKRAGGQHAAAELADISQSTVSRTLEPGSNATYTTLLKLSKALPGLPSPVVAVRDDQHERWCRVGAVLADRRPALFGVLLTAAVDAIRPSDAAVEKLLAVVSDPMPPQRAEPSPSIDVKSNRRRKKKPRD